MRPGSEAPRAGRPLERRDIERERRQRRRAVAAILLAALLGASVGLTFLFFR